MRNPLFLLARGGSGWEGWLSKTELFENPLVPNKKMQQLYTGDGGSEDA